jgi:PAS domain S-box-containing protein
MAVVGKANLASRPHKTAIENFAQWLNEHRESILHRWLAEQSDADQPEYFAGSMADASTLLRALSDPSAADQFFGVPASQESTTPPPASTSALNLTAWHAILRDLQQSIVAELKATTSTDQAFELLLDADNAISELVNKLACAFQQQLDRLTEERGHFESLYTVTREIASNLDLRRVARSALDGALKIVGADMGLLLILDREAGQLFPWASTEWDVQPIETKSLPADWIEGWREEPIPPIGDMAALPQATWPSALQLPPTTAALIITPIVSNGEFYGLLVLGSEQTNHFKNSGLISVKAITTQVASVSENAEVYRLINRQAQELGGMLRHQQEEASKSQAILDSIADGVVVNNPKGQVILMNPAAERILNRSRHDLITTNVHDLIKAFDAPERTTALTAIEQTLAQANSPSQIKVTSVILEMDKRVISAHMAPVIARHDEFLGVVTIFHDITKEVEADRAKSEFISTVSHELRTPMTAIKGYTDLLYGGVVGPLNDNQEHFLNVIKNNSNRLIALINDLLDISRIETGLVRFEPVPVKIGEIITDVVEAVAASAQEKGLTLTYKVDAGLPEVMGDRDRLYQVLTNLIGNAFNYTPEGSVSVAVTKVGEAVQVSVHDTGIGVKSEDIGRIFDRFYRAEDPLVQEASGTGLGLPIVKMFVEMHGGRVWVDSEEGTGSTFTFILPALGAEVKPEESPSSSLGPPGTAKSILVVEDDTDIARLVRVQLERNGYRVLTANRGNQALEVVKEEKLDLILLERLLSDTDGLTILDTLKTDPSAVDIPVIVLSIVEDDGEAMARGASAYLLKPFNEELLLDKVVTVLARHGRVLIVEDNKDTAGMLTQALQHVGFATEVANDGYEALASARRTRPDVILLDLRLPGMDGYEALTHLKRGTATGAIPIIAISAHVANPAAERERLIALGATDFLLKPLGPEGLISAVDRALEAARAGNLPVSNNS